jgi:hypothetical protein
VVRYQRFLRLSSKPPEVERVIRLIIAIVAGLVIGVVAVGFGENLLSNAANGTPSNSTIYVYGTR